MTSLSVHLVHSKLTVIASKSTDAIVRSSYNCYRKGMETSSDLPMSGRLG